jgi:hypothetical protein
MPVRAKSHPTLVRIPEGTPLYDDRYCRISKVMQTHDHTIYRHKRGGKWARLAIYKDMPIQMPACKLTERPAGIRTVRTRVDWNDCVILNARPSV